jgi:hypothetical protein
MNWKLGKGKGVCKMLIDWSILSRCPWPSQVIELDGLQSFSLRRGYIDPERPLSQLHLSTLSRNLKKLELNCDASLEALNALHSTHPGHFHCLEILKVTGFRSNGGHIAFEAPTVKDLEISNFGERCCLASLSLLPPNLTRLKLSRVSMPNSGDFMDLFPASLLTLEVGWLPPDKNWPTILQLLPSGIEHLKIFLSVLEYFRFSEEHWRSLSKFKNLKCLFLPVCGLFTIEYAQLIPRSVEKLNLGFIYSRTEDWCIELLKSGALPPKLKILEGIWPSETIPIDIAKHLPCTVEKIGDQAYDPETVSHLPHSIREARIKKGNLALLSTFPSSLRHLSLPMLPHSLAKKLPHSLQSLVIRTEELELSLETFELLPRNLTELDSHWTPGDDTSVEQLFQVLPSTLTNLNLTAFAGVAEKVSFPTPSHSSLFLPRVMKTLEIECLDFSSSSMAEWINGLPKTLTMLSIFVNHLQNDSFSSLGELSALDRLDIVVQNHPKEGWASILKDCRSLPRKLTSLHLKSRLLNSDQTMSKFYLSDIKNSTFKYAPLSLRRINVPRSPHLNKDCLVYLPNLEVFWEEYEMPSWWQDQLTPRHANAPSKSIFSRLIVYILSWFFSV